MQKILRGLRGRLLPHWYDVAFKNPDLGLNQINKSDANNCCSQCWTRSWLVNSWEYNIKLWTFLMQDIPARFDFARHELVIGSISSHVLGIWRLIILNYSFYVCHVWHPCDTGLLHDLNPWLSPHNCLSIWIWRHYSGMWAGMTSDIKSLKFYPTKNGVKILKYFSLCPQPMITCPRHYVLLFY